VGSCLQRALCCPSPSILSRDRSSSHVLLPPTVRSSMSSAVLLSLQNQELHNPLCVPCSHLRLLCYSDRKETYCL
jgi:hypothetical protein